MLELTLHSLLTTRPLHLFLAPFSSRQLEALLILLSVFKDIYARDNDGCTVFDHVDGMGSPRPSSYVRDLWYCALDRAGFDVSQHLIHHPRTPTYTLHYTPEHYHALKHLDSWNKDNFRSQMDGLLEEIPLSREESMVMQATQEEEPSRRLAWRPSPVWEIISTGDQHIVQKREQSEEE